MDVNTALLAVYNGLSETFKKTDFGPEIPKNVSPKDYEIPVVTENGQDLISVKGEKGELRIAYANDRMSLLFSENDGDFTCLSLCLFEAENATQSDTKYIVSEFEDTLSDKFLKKQVFTGSKSPVPVSKAQAKSGAMAYDPNTLGSRLTDFDISLKEPYKANIEKYGEFLCEEFFERYGTPVVIDTIKKNDPKRMKKLFDMLNDLFENGNNDVQSLIAVSILGQLENDQTLIANCLDYMGFELKGLVIQVNKHLASSSGKGDKMRLENPPPYKPKKKKKSIMSSLMGGGGMPGGPLG